MATDHGQDSQNNETGFEGQPALMMAGQPKQ